MTNLLDGRAVIVTGGARGIGACICRVLASHGAQVVVNYSASADAAQAVVDEIVAAGGQAIAVAGDVRNLADFEGLAAAAVTQFGRLDGVVNNAVSGRQHGAFAEITDQDIRDMVDFGAIAVANSVRACLPQFTDGGRVVNIVTEVWNMAGAEWTAYMAGKGAMVGISRSLATELGPQGVTVNMVAPGWMVTEKVDPTSEGSRKFGESLPLRHHGSGDEIGKACAFFLSDLAGYITGAYLPVTGGRITQMGA